MLERHDAASRALELSKARLSQITAIVSGTSGGIGVLVQLGIMGATGLFALNGLVSVGSVIAVTQLLGDVISPASEISSKLARSMRVRKSLPCSEASRTSRRRAEGA